MDFNFYINTSYLLSRTVTRKYSTSFSLATSLLEKEKRMAIYAIYGFVRVADEIVDSFQGFNQSYLFDNFTEETEYALNNGVSTNPVLMAFVHTVKKFNIEKRHIDAFLASMRRDLTKKEYNNKNELAEYIYGSADVVGLMCLKVFCNGNQNVYNKLESHARCLGSAFQKVNFLRDLKSDMHELGRIYFPELAGEVLNVKNKLKIEQSIEDDFSDAWKGVIQLPGKSKLAVAIAWFYYYALFNKIKKSPPERLLSERIRISNAEKMVILVGIYGRYITKTI